MLIYLRYYGLVHVKLVVAQKPLVEDLTTKYCCTRSALCCTTHISNAIHCLLLRRLSRCPVI